MKQQVLIQDKYYHIFNRSVLRHKIYKNEINYRFFMYKIAFYKQKYRINIAIYTIMPNHFHMLVKCSYIPAKTSKFLQVVQQSYSNYYNKMYDGSGHVFQGRFRRRLVKGFKDYKDTFDYVNQNPVTAGLVKKPEDWPYRMIYGTV